MEKPSGSTTLIDSVRYVLKAEAEAIQSIPLTQSIDVAVAAILTCKGKLFTTGIGKAGYVARKAASTFSTTGTPSVFLHPGDASHGDVGVVTSCDLILAFSNSGRTREVLETIDFCRKLEVKQVITVCATDDSDLAKLSDIVLPIGKIAEPCPLGFTPSASTAAMTALADALALTVMSARGFSTEDFAVRHHGGYLGIKSREKNK